MFICGMLVGIIIGCIGIFVWGFYLLAKEKESNAETVTVEFSDGTTGKYVREEK